MVFGGTSTCGESGTCKIWPGMMKGAPATSLLMRLQITPLVLHVAPTAPSQGRWEFHSGPVPHACKAFLICLHTLHHPVALRVVGRGEHVLDPHQCACREPHCRRWIGWPCPLWQWQARQNEQPSWWWMQLQASMLSISTASTHLETKRKSKRKRTEELTGGAPRRLFYATQQRIAITWEPK